LERGALARAVLKGGATSSCAKPCGMASPAMPVTGRAPCHPPALRSHSGPAPKEMLGSELSRACAFRSIKSPGLLSILSQRTHFLAKGRIFGTTFCRVRFVFIYIVGSIAIFNIFLRQPPLGTFKTPCCAAKIGVGTSQIDHRPSNLSRRPDSSILGMSPGLSSLAS
jgi:hypothetical protein